MDLNAAEIYRKLNLPEIVEIDEPATVVEFSVDLTKDHPEVELLNLVSNYLSDNARRPLLGFACSYYLPEDSLPFLQAAVFLGEPLNTDPPTRQSR